MQSKTDKRDDVLELRPSLRPFVLRPIFYTMIPAGFLLAGSFFFWTFLQSLLGQYALAVPGVAVALLVLVTIERIVRYRKTRYEVGPERIVVETGTIFRSRKVELDLRNVTLVEWRSPWLLRKFYDVGHVVAQEAGSAAQPAQMAYVEHPSRLYERIGEHMRRRGFSMSRANKLREEQPGHLGAAVDLSSSLIAMFWAVILIGAQIAFEALPLLIGEGPSLLQLVMGNYEVFAESTAVSTLVRARVGVLVLGTLTVGLTGFGILIAYIDLLHRKYTLYDDVIDYVDGFLNETRKFIPLENLADTEVSRPFYKRVLGLSDVRLSSQGAENSIAFASTPNGPAFADAVEALVRDSKREISPSEPAADARAVVEVEEAQRSVERTFELRPEPIRAALRGFGVSTLVVSGVVGVLLDFVGESWDLNLMTAIGVWGAAVTAIVALTVVAGAGAAWWVIRAQRTTFTVDPRGVRQRLDLFSTKDRRFSLDRITSVSVLRNPLDRLLGTMTVRFRSIGSQEDLDFWGVADDTRLLSTIREYFGFGEARSAEFDDFDAPDGRLTPNFTVMDAIRARGPAYAFVVVPFGALGVLMAFAMPSIFESGVAFGVAAGLPLFAVGLHIGVRAVIVGRIHGDVRTSHVEVSGGVLRHFRHFAPLEHVKAVETVRYPGSNSGRLTFRTAGFPIQIDHLAVVERLHRAVDERLGGAALSETSSLARYKPHMPTEMIRHGWLIATVIGLPAMLWFYLYYRRVEYAVENGRLVADSGLYFSRRVTVLVGRVDHIETKTNFAHGFFSTYDVEVYTVGSPLTDLVFRSVRRDDGLIETVRDQLE